MGKALVIVESPTKANTITRFLGKDCEVHACLGHIRALPSKQGSIAQKNADRLFRMVSDILDLARIDAGRFERRLDRFDVATSIRGTIDRLRHLAQERGIVMSLVAPGDDFTVSADSMRMEQVFANLLGNALKFTPRGGRIDVAVEDMGADVLVTVADTGVGIPSEHLDRVFDRFNRVPLPAGSSVEGTGLGLSICKAVVEEHGGRIWIESQVGRGSRFFVAIPKALAAPARSFTKVSGSTISACRNRVSPTCCG